MKKKKAKLQSSLEEAAVDIAIAVRLPLLFCALCYVHLLVPCHPQGARALPRVLLTPEENYAVL